MLLQFRPPLLGQITTQRIERTSPSFQCDDNLLPFIREDITPSVGQERPMFVISIRKVIGEGALSHFRIAEIKQSPCHRMPALQFRFHARTDGVFADDFQPAFFIAYLKVLVTSFLLFRITISGKCRQCFPGGPLLAEIPEPAVEESFKGVVKAVFHTLSQKYRFDVVVRFPVLLRYYIAA